MNQSKTIKTFWNEKWVEVTPPSSTKTNNYYISNYGRIKSVNKVNLDEKLLKGSKSPRGGYRTLNIRLVGKKSCSVYIHKFVAEYFLRKEGQDKEFVVHLDEDKNNNHWQNLKWMSRSELTKWQIDHGVFDSQNKKRGSNTKMTETKVKILKQRIKEGKTKEKVLAKNFNISLAHLKRIQRGQYWGYVQLDESGIKNE